MAPGSVAMRTPPSNGQSSVQLERGRLSFSSSQAKDARRARASASPSPSDELQPSASLSAHHLYTPPRSPAQPPSMSPVTEALSAGTGAGAEPGRTEMDPGAVQALMAHGYEVVRELSDGSFGAVYRATRIVDGLDVAAKAVRRNRLTPDELTSVHSQGAVLAGLRHENVVRLVEAFEHPQYIFHVFEFLHGGDLFDRLEARGRPFNERSALELAGQMLRAVGFLHARRAAHRDIKLENFVFATVPTAPTPVLKLIDFDLLLVRGRDVPPGATCTDMCGTVLYVPPELAAAREYVPEEADLWAVGVVLYVLLCFEMPFQGKQPRDILSEVRNANPSFAGAPWRQISRPTRHLVQSLLSKSGAARPSAEEALARVESILSVPVSFGRPSVGSRRYLGIRWLSVRRKQRVRTTQVVEHSADDFIQGRASQDELDGLRCYEAAVAGCGALYDRDGVEAEKLDVIQRLESEDTMLTLQKMRNLKKATSPMGRMLSSGTHSSQRIKLPGGYNWFSRTPNSLGGRRITVVGN